MTYQTLQIFLPAFMLVFIGTVCVWAYFRKRKSVQLTSSQRKSISMELRLLDLFFKVLLVLSAILAVVYAYFPEYYYVAGPIELLDSPVVNTVGVLVLKCSLVWIVMAQFNIERTISLLNSGVVQASFSKLLHHSQKLILTGILIMFFGLFITISSILTAMILISAILLFERVQRKLTLH
jgi:hypothetical protein